ncbi:MAG: thiamine phosphate synthase [Hydrogenothermaceae bacterium]|nr:thiamine phosphate synthase [Hydrogenothermaceae bacterium]
MDRLYFITDRKKFKKPFLDQIKSVLDKGVRVIQIREKDLPDDELYKLVEDTLEVAKGYDVKIFVNSRVDIAVLLGLYGVHLPEKSIPIKVVKQKFSNLVIGKSCHTVEEAIKAQEEGADYIFFSPIFEVEGKSKPVGLDGLRELLKKVSIPVYALGGINMANVRDVLNTGVYGVAGIRMFLED